MLSESIRLPTSGSERRSLTIARLPSSSEVLTVTQTSDVRSNPGNLRLLQVDYFTFSFLFFSDFFFYFFVNHMNIVGFVAGSEGF